jgi:hypothetical protein
MRGNVALLETTTPFAIRFPPPDPEETDANDAFRESNMASKSNATPGIKPRRKVTHWDQEAALFRRPHRTRIEATTIAIPRVVKPIITMLSCQGRPRWPIPDRPG